MFILDNIFREDWRTILDYCHSKTVNVQDSSQLTQSKISVIKEAGYEINVWTVNKASCESTRNWGIDGIFTDNADKLIHLSIHKNLSYKPTNVIRF